MCVSEICCHRRGASRDFERSRFTSRDHSGVPVVQNHWQSVESAAFRSWPFKIPSARVDQLHVSFFSKLFILTLGGTLRPSWFVARSSVGRWDAFPAGNGGIGVHRRKKGLIIRQCTQHITGNN